MNDSAVRTVFITICLVALAAGQDLLPALGGVKAPLLTLFALQTAFRDDDEHRPGGTVARSWRWVVVAIAAGLLEDALNGGQLACSVLFIPAVAAVARAARAAMSGFSPVLVGIAAGLVAAPLRELWLSACWPSTAFAAPLVVRLFAAGLSAAMAGGLLFAQLPKLERHVGFDGTASSRRFT